jgi:flagellar basal body-associated protein FliL
MEVCSFDWELASKFIPLINPIITIIIAIAVYKIWHKQKEKEYLSKIANDLILKDMMICLGMTKHTTAEAAKIYMIEIESYFNNIRLFSLLIKDNKCEKVLKIRYDYMVKYFNTLYTNPDYFFSTFIKENPYHDEDYLNSLIAYITYKK